MTTIEGAPAARPASGLRLWQIALIVAFVAIAIRNIQEQRRSEPALIALAAVGFVGYGLSGWLIWRNSDRVVSRTGSTGRLVGYLIFMAGFFMLATVIYLVAEHTYLNL